MHQIISEKLPQLIKICKEHKVTKLYIFGSALTENFDINSDIDFLVEFEKKLLPEERGELYWQLDELLPKLFSRKIDLITTSSLKNKYFIENINKTKFAIYE
ncbi:MAG: nucleotidyltransferase domain-containing protein [Bacteroidales bacterium]|nr:nucleotidyltransferase domain-containing protein [Bacteroidales bacterium]